MDEIKSKNCPLSYAVTTGAYSQPISDFAYCIEKECAWWEEGEQECCVKSFMRTILKIVAKDEIKN